MQLVAQHDNLELLRLLRAQPKQDQLEQAPQHPLHERDQQVDGALPVDEATLRRQPHALPVQAPARSGGAPDDQPAPRHLVTQIEFSARTGDA
jgi:hypothetical protein